MTDTIAAISTGQVLSGIGVLRLSGPEAIAVVERVFTPAHGAPMSARPDRLLVYGTLRSAAGDVLDVCLCTVSRAPHSYTGEDTAELQCHGSPTVLREGLEALFAAGARQARAGEFTKRAFLNGCLDLTQAEAVIDLIHAETAEQARNAAGQLGGAVTRKTDAVYDQLAAISAHFHAVVDYPDEDIPDFRLAAYEADLAAAEASLKALLDSFSRGRVLTGGVPTAIVGRPNAGKSSLLNALLGYERAIVTDIPGTTRDVLTERISLGGVVAELSDTAGRRDTEDPIERIGVDRAQRAAEGADVVLIVIDAAEPLDASDEALLKGADDRCVVCLNKRDAGQAVTREAVCALTSVRVLETSALTGQGIPQLVSELEKRVSAQQESAGQMTALRHIELAHRAADHLRQAVEAVEGGLPLDTAAIDMRAALSDLSEITGENATEEVIDRVFRDFCVGK